MTVTSVEAPPRNLYDVGGWLCQRHPDLMELCGKIGAVRDDRVDVARVRDSVISFDEYHRARLDHNRKNGLKEPDPQSSALGPQPTEAVAMMRLMLPSQVACLRLLATIAPQLYGWPNVEWCVDNLASVTNYGLIADWWSAMAGFVHAGD